MAAATAPNPLLVLVRILGILVLIPVGLVAAILLIVAGVETVYFFHNRPVDAANLATKAGVDLAPDVGSLSALKGALGPPTGQVRAPEAENATNYWWGHDEAVQAEAVDDGVVSVDFGARKQRPCRPTSGRRFRARCSACASASRRRRRPLRTRWKPRRRTAATAA